ncbi:MAG: cytochrome c [Saprospiraceae bacterium]|nr:cytochrome c [Saprospiraceae bacterium]MBK7737074.1 cytochrome c [Saprospiraceae bacterium]MBK7914331.1 cytochrome c [Saprospiraceae bacterium]
MMNRIIFIFISIVSALSLFQCSPAGGNATGTEYMPDMVHSVAYEPNVNSYYYYHTWGTSAEIAKLSAPRFPVKGSIARGGISISDSAHAAMYTGSLSSNAIHTPVNGSVNYYYGNTEEERLRASREITTNKVKLTTAGLNEGKLLYNIYCGICHGEKGDGAGYLVRDDGGKYPAQPANFLKDEFIAASEGRFYHGIMYGKNMMGAYADKLSYNERWNVIHYIRSLQAASKNLKYSESENTFSGSQAVLDAAKLAAAATAPVVNVKK